MNLKWTLSLLLALMQGFACTRTQVPDAPTRFAIFEHGQWGYADANGKVVIPTQYRSASAFSDPQGLMDSYND